MNKKGVELSVNVIIIAAISLAVLVVLFAIFTGRLGAFSRGVQETADTCAQKCASLNLQKIDDTQFGCSERASGTFIAGKFSDTPKNGCCCYSKEGQFLI